MSVPFGYRIENGKAVIDEEAAEKIKVLFQSYLSGNSLETAAKKAGIKVSHSGIGRILRNAKYLGDEYYPAIIDYDTFQAAQAERFIRVEQLGRIRQTEKEEEVIFPTTFHMREVTDELDDPFAQAEYIYSLIEVMEVNENGGK